MEDKPQNAVLLSVTVALNIIGWMIMVFAIGMGIIHLNSCPAQPYIPIYLIVLGASSLLLLVMSYIQSPREQGVVSILTSACIRLLHTFNICWFVAGTLWVYAINHPSYSDAKDGYCQKNIYHFAYYLTSLCWLLVIATLFYGGCLLLRNCWDAGTRGRGLSGTMNDSYGGTNSNSTVTMG